MSESLSIFGRLSHRFGIPARSDTRRGVDPLIAAVVTQVFEKDSEYQGCLRAISETAPQHPPGTPGPNSTASATAIIEPTAKAAGLVDFLFAGPADPRLPQEVFDRLRWGGQFVFVSRQEEEVCELAGKFKERRGFILEREPASIRVKKLGLSLPGLCHKAHFFSARKVLLVQPGQMTDRFTYDVRLVRMPAPRTGYAVLKQIPEFDSVVARLRDRLPDAGMEVIIKGARKLVDKVFPVFLTRESAFLSILNRDLPAPYNERIPRIIDLQKDSQGFVRKLYLQWLRNGRSPMSQLDFARQSAELVRVLHEQVGIIHLDLRLDNFVITEKGVGFVDFGSAVRVDENLTQNPMLRTLFSEMMTTSQIQRDLGRMMRKGKVTSRMLVDSHHKVDKAVDLFYLALQMNDPHANPDFEDLVQFDPLSKEASELALLTAEVLKPADPENPTYKSAADILTAIKKIEGALAVG